MAIKFLNNVAVDSSVLYVDTVNDRVGIGTTVPRVPLQVSSSAVDTDFLIECGNTQSRMSINNTGSGDSQINFQLSNSNKFTIGVDNSDSGKFKISGSSSLGFNDRIVVDSGGSVGIGTTSPGVYRLNVAGVVNFQAGSTVPGFDVVNITGGAVQRNTQADDSNSSTGSECLRLKHAGVDDGNFGLMITFRDSSGNIKGKISSTSTSTTYATSSDQRLKEDPKDFDALNLISQIQPYDFKWKTSGERDFGFYAQELNEVLPQAVDVPTLDDGVTIDEDAMLMADYTKLVPVLVKAIQQLKDKIQTLKNQ